MSNETKIGQLVIDLKIKTEALEKGLETAKKKIQEIEQNNKQLENSNKGVEGSYLAMSATAVIAVTQIIGIIKNATEEYKAHTQAMSSLQNVADYTDKSMSDLSNIMNKYDGIINKTDLTTTIKNFTLMGMTVEETDKMIQSLTNSAIRNRNSNYTVSEAVRVASDGYRQGISTLSDSAGVTENLSVMLDKHAQSLGKTASQLTETEKNQAYLNRTMQAAEPFAGAMETYLDSLAGKQGEFSQSLRETKVAFTESLEPTLIKIEELKTGAMKTLTEYIEKNKSGTAGVVSFAVALTSLVAVIKLSKTAMSLLNTTMLASPITWIVAGLSALLGISVSVSTALEEQRIAQEELTNAQNTHNSVLEKTIELNEENINTIQTRKDQLDEYITKLEEYNNLNSSINLADILIEQMKSNGESEEKIKSIQEEVEQWKYKVVALNTELKTTSDEFKEIFEIEKEGLVIQEDLNGIIEAYNDNLKKANAIKNASKAFNVDSIKTQQKEAAQLKVTANQMQDYLNIIKNGNKNATEYQEAVNALTKAYPEASSAGGLLIDVLEGLISAEQLQADEAWSASQTSIQGHIDNIQAALNDENVQRQVAANMGMAYDETFRPKLEAILQLLQLIGGYTPSEVPNITPTTTTRKTTGSKSYSNKALDNYKKDIEHKKALDHISIQQEISMYEHALKKYAKTTDEKRELREKIYDLNKELAQKEKEILDQQTEDYEAYIQEQKNLRGSAYDITEQTSDYNKIIQMHKNYLNQIMQDERLSLEERKEIYREELQIIRDYEQQKRDLRVEQIDNTVSQLTEAITKQLEEMQEKDKEMIDKNIEEVEKWKETRINAINEEYDARIEAINKELEALDKAEQQKTRDEEDAEYESKKKRLEELVAFEHDATTKANYQKELDKLIAEYQNTLDKRTLEDKKEALNAQKDLLQEEQDGKVQAIEDEVEKQKEIYEKQLTDLEKYYEEQINIAQETAEKMLINVEQNQDNILNLLKSYGNAYEITGQSLGEKLAQGINEGIASKITNIIQRIQDTIDAGIENKLAELSGSVYRYEAGSNKPQTTNINITQQNYIEQNPEMPSETYRKLRNIDEELAATLAGM